MTGIAVYIVIFVSLVTATFLNSSLAIVSIFLLYPLDQWATIKAVAHIKSSAVTNILIGLVVAFTFAVSLIRGKLLHLKIGPIYGLVGLLYVYAATTLLWSPAPQENVQDWYLGSLYLIVFLTLMPLLIQKEEDPGNILKTFLILGIPLGLFLLLFVDWGYRGFVQGSGRNLVAINPLALGQFGGYLVIAGVLLQRTGMVWGGIRLAAIPIGCLLVFQSGSRGQFIAMVFCVSLFFFLNAGKKNSIIKLIFLSLLAFLFTAGAYVEIAGILGGDSPLGKSDARWDLDNSAASYAGRWHLAGILFDKWISSGIFMIVGLGNSASYDPYIIGTYPHVVPVEILCEEGLIGFTIYLLVLWRLLICIRKVISRPRDEFTNRAAALTFVAFAIFEMLLTLKQGSLLGNWSFFAFVILVERIEMALTKGNDWPAAGNMPRKVTRPGIQKPRLDQSDGVKNT